MIAGRRARQLAEKRRDRVSGRRQPWIPRIGPCPLFERVLGEEQQMLGLFGQQLVRFVPLLELHRLVANPQRAHLEPAEVLVGRGGNGGGPRHQSDRRQHTFALCTPGRSK